MTELADISGKEALRVFVRLGYRVIRQRGSHVRMKHHDPSRHPLTIPMHKVIALGLMHRLLRDAGITMEEFKELL